MSEHTNESRIPLLELLLLTALVSLVVQVVPNFQDRVLSAADVRSWSRTTWALANTGLLLTLLWFRFGPAVWYTIIELAKRRAAKRTATSSAEVPSSPKLSEYYFKPRQDVRKLLREDEAKRFMAKRRLVVRGILLAAVVGCLSAVAWGKFAHHDAAGTDFQQLFAHHPGGLRGSDGIIGSLFQARDDKDIRITHMGIFDSGEDGMHLVHRIGLFEVEGADMTKGKMIAQARVPVGKEAMLRDGYRWEALKKPVALKAGRQYILCAEIYAGGKDLYPDCFLSDGKDPAVPNWNEYFVGGQPLFQRRPLTRDGQPWPHPPTKDLAPDSGAAFGVVNIADMTSVPDPPPDSKSKP